MEDTNTMTIQYPHTDLKKARIGDKLTNTDHDVSRTVKIVGYNKNNEELTCIDPDTEDTNLIKIKVNSNHWIVTNRENTE